MQLNIGHKPLDIASKHLLDLSEMRRTRELMVIETPQGPHMALGRDIAQDWPGMYAEAWRTGNRRQFPLEQLGKPVEFGEDYDMRQIALDWICVHASIYPPIPFQPWNPFALQRYDFFQDRLQLAMNASMTGQIMQLDSLMRPFIDVFDWVIKLLERDGGYAPPGGAVYTELHFVVMDSLPLLLQIPAGGDIAMEIIRKFHRVYGKDLFEIWMLLCSLPMNEQLVLLQAAQTRATLYMDILGMKIDQLLTGQPYPANLQWMIDQY